MRQKLSSEITRIDNAIEGFLDKIADGDSATVVSVYERRIEKLEMEKSDAKTRLETAKNGKSAADNLEPALRFFSNPWKLWETGRNDLRRMMLRLAFEDRLEHSRKQVLETRKPPYLSMR